MNIHHHTLAALVVVAGVTLATPAPAQNSKQYSVKFVCGAESEGQILARGLYSTAINIQNPNQAAGAGVVQYDKSISVARPNETSGGVTGLLGPTALDPGSAVEIDCPDIFRLARDFCNDEFCTGFVTLQANADLEIVAVYSAADLDTQQVTSIHTERVTDAGRCPVRTETIDSQTILFVPPHVRGDREFDGNGPCVRFDLDLRLPGAGDSLVAEYYMHAFECADDDPSRPKSDFTAAEGRGATTLFSTGPQGRILAYNVGSATRHTYVDDDHAEDVFNLPAPDPSLQLRYIGDTGGNEAGTETRVFIQLRDIELTYEDCGPSQRVEG